MLVKVSSSCNSASYIYFQTISKLDGGICFKRDVLFDASICVDLDACCTILYAYCKLKCPLFPFEDLSPAWLLKSVAMFSYVYKQ
jgi:hypothetical protein